MIPLRIRRALSTAALIAVGLFAVWLLSWGVAILGTASVDRDELEQLPVVVVQVGAGDTWWDLAAPCDVDRRVAVQWLTEMAGTDPDTPLHVGDLALTCGIES
jgi:hypothetical protein